ncbi:MAG: transcriptional regulator [Anaerolineae bacterium]|nr:transcriptional regulator [Anaerolineae bacterium]
MAKEYLVVTVVGPDRRGIVEKISAVVLDYQANIEESKMARLGGEFAVIMLLTLPGEKEEALLTGLDRLKEYGLTVISRPTNLSRLERFQGYIPYEISVFGADHEGIVHRVAHYITVERMNIEKLDTQVSQAPVTGTPLFSMQATVQAPPDLTIGQLRQKLAELGDELCVDIEIKPLVSQR